MPIFPGLNVSKANAISVCCKISDTDINSINDIPRFFSQIFRRHLDFNYLRLIIYELVHSFILASDFIEQLKSQKYSINALMSATIILFDV